jgi:hypothetical protein
MKKKLIAELLPIFARLAIFIALQSLCLFKEIEPLVMIIIFCRYCSKFFEG